ncbi:hypothetical protein [Bathymodiolus azoricus thioautotrophic gill symbiont]|jgi:hypothetical protein|uniref:Uncharacterized protein n=3 Tax=sulfur-oxidizing symbionts TaxID=32036 RepID=A0A1H6N3M1_9GAMM|nr:hypothetical protein [Bathymodiolus azoricus thioautotrophic gill symbiont]SEI04857.1 hypothetical protein BAZSYMA_ACONTIG00279_2 [Bathymodiolus azoricus thioautotrophic gill symbiont]
MDWKQELMTKFKSFFDTKVTKETVIIAGEEQQKHSVLLDKNESQEIEYFKLDKVVEPCNKTIRNLKACDYVLVDHDKKKVLLCELKNSKDRDTISRSKKQLDHSKHIVNLFLNILKADKYSYVLLTLTKKKMNKQRIRNKETSAQIYSETGKKEFKFNSQKFKL